MKKLNFLLLFLFFSHSAFATIWITISDSHSQKIGVVGASSGYIGDYRTMVAVENEGIAVVGAWYIDRKQNHLKSVLKDHSLSAREKVSKFSSLINRDQHKRRVSLVTKNFENASEPGRGCHQNNDYCGKFEGGHFSITGGGLESENVILHTSRILLDSVTQSLPFECQMYKGIEAVFNSGGEIKTINRLAYMTDDVAVDNDLKHEVFYRKGSEKNLLQQFKESLRKQGILCE